MDRPREKLLLRGKNNLSDAELLAILLRSGTQSESALALAQRILNAVDYNLKNLGQCTVHELKQYRGVGEAKAITILAAMEIGRRRQLPGVSDPRNKVTSSFSAYELIAPLLHDLHHEEFWIILLNRANKLVGRERISTGGVSGTIVDAKLIFQKALTTKTANSIILVHNHPSGNLRPSKADVNITQKLVQAGESLDLAVLDHLIIAGNSYFSFADEGMM